MRLTDKVGPTPVSSLFRNNTALNYVTALLASHSYLIPITLRVGLGIALSADCTTKYN